jgi:hypothetical protein
MMPIRHYNFLPAEISNGLSAGNAYGVGT